MARLFGTDGIRGVANVDLKPTLAYALGARHRARTGRASAGTWSSGQDTRRSGDMFVSAIAAGATSLGSDVHVAGVVPTPALAFLAAQPEFAAGIMVSASHNPADDNGLKVLDRDGLKLDDTVEDELEALIWRAEELGGVTNAALGRVVADAGLLDRYRAHRLALASAIDAPIRVVLDCANGSGGVVGPEILRATGAEVRGDPQRARRREHQRALRRDRSRVARAGRPGAGRGRRVRARRRRRPADRGGRARRRSSTATRCWASSRSIGSRAARCRAAGSWCRCSRTAGSSRRSRPRAGVVIRTPVGDKYILEGMQVSGAMLGGEKSGHVIVMEHTTSGDGIVTALEVLRVMCGAGARLAELAGADPAAAPAAACREGPPQGPVGGRSGAPCGDPSAPGSAWATAGGSSSGPRGPNRRSV